MTSKTNKYANRPERWKYIAGYARKYQASNQGRIRHTLTGKLVSQRVRADGYVQANLTYAPGKKRTVQVHRIITLTFIPNPENKPEVNHKNLVKHHNQAHNLEWVTDQENRDHYNLMVYTPASKYRPKGPGYQDGECNHQAKLTWDKVEAIRTTYKAGGVSHRQLADQYDISKTQITNLLNNKTWVVQPRRKLL